MNTRTKSAVLTLEDLQPLVAKKSYCSKITLEPLILFIRFKNSCKVCLSLSVVTHTSCVGTQGLNTECQQEMAVAEPLLLFMFNG